MSPKHFKDAVLDSLSSSVNIAQFVSFAPGPVPRQRFAHIEGREPNLNYPDPASAIADLFEHAAEGSLNVRRFSPDRPQAWPFDMGLKEVSTVLAAVRSASQEGLYSIVNEMISVDDGGVGGVVHGQVIEFAPNDTPRSVERSGTLTLSRVIGVELLSRVYHVRPALDFDDAFRVEFTLHTRPVGLRKENTVIWEVEPLGGNPEQRHPTFPSNFSAFIGDKTFGLALADVVGLPVPATIAVPRAIAPFSFGRRTGTGEFWLRTCPRSFEPGRFPTFRGWRDPFAVLQAADPDGVEISAVLAQEGVRSAFSGALVPGPDGDVVIEGVRGHGIGFMSGIQRSERLPRSVTGEVATLYSEASKLLGPIQMEWALDDSGPWVIQMRLGSTRTVGDVIVPGDVEAFRQFDVRAGLDSLRDLVSEVRETKYGIELVGDIGITSHMGDLLRNAGIPSRIRKG